MPTQITRKPYKIDYTISHACPLNSSVMIMNEWGLKTAESQLKRIIKLGNRKINFVVTVHCRLDDNLNVQSYGMIRSLPGWHYTEFNENLLSYFRQRLIRIFKNAAKYNVDIAILPHLDAAGPKFGWRNRFDFDPVKKYKGYSYIDILISPITDALYLSIKPGINIEFALTGEMGKTVFKYPASYIKILKALRSIKKFEYLKLGPSINFNEVSGGYMPSRKKLDNLQKLLDMSDFLGVACYMPVHVPPTPKDFRDTETGFIKKLNFLGLNLKPEMEIHFSEVGIGGGGQNSHWEDVGIAKSPQEAARSPWSGTTNPMENPWSKPDMIKFRRTYYKSLLYFLKYQKNTPWPVTAAFLWNVGSWDPQGINDPEFKDPVIIKMIMKHNKEVSD